MLEVAGAVPILAAMAALFFRRVLACLIVVAYLGAANAVPVMRADAAELGSQAMHDTGGGADTPMPPCKGMAAGCVTELGCLFLVGALAAPVDGGTTFAWSSITYHPAAAAFDGRTLEPALGPPISRA